MYAFDSGQFGRGTITQEGFLRVPVTMTRIGVMDYNGTKKVKLPSELGSNATLDSLRNLPIVNEHPAEGNRHIFVNPENVQRYIKGAVSEPVFDGEFVRGWATIMEKGLIEDIQAGKKEVSLGYSKEDDFSSGVFNGESYDCVQRNIIANHLAITEKGRAGEKVRLELDSDGKILKGEPEMKEKWIKQVDGKEASDAKMMTLRTNAGTDIQVDSEIHAEIMTDKKTVKESKAEVDSLKKENEDLKKKLEDAEKNLDVDSQVKTVQAELDRTKIELDAEKTKSETLQTKLDEKEKSFDSEVQAAAKESLELSKNAKLFGIETDGKDNITIKRDIISAGLSKDGHQLKDVEVDAYYMAALQLKRDKAQEGGKGGTNTVGSPDTDSIKKSRAEQIAKMQKDYDSGK
jgi:hypothetical protein